MENQDDDNSEFEQLVKLYGVKLLTEASGIAVSLFGDTCQCFVQSVKIRLAFRSFGSDDPRDTMYVDIEGDGLQTDMNKKDFD